MLTSSEECSRKPRKKSRNCFSASFSVLFSCVSKNKSKLKPRIANSSVQCDLLFSNREPKDALRDDFELSINQIDSLINTLQDIKEKYRDNYGPPRDQLKILAPASTNSLKYSGEITKFNVNINEKAYIECITTRGKHSLTIFDKKSTLGSGDNKNILDSNPTEQALKNVACLEKNYLMLSENFGKFSSIMSKHVSVLRKDMRFLRAILSSIQCKFGGNLMMSQMEINKKDKSLLPSDEFKFVKAKLRASTFCKFYNMRYNQNIGKKKTRKKHEK